MCDLFVVAACSVTIGMNPCFKAERADPYQVSKQVLTH